MSEDSKIEQFASSLRGRLILRDNPEYDHARTIFNAMIDKRPRMIARCANVADVIAAVNFGRDRGLDTSIRGGGHNGPGLALIDDGLVIDLSSMKGIRVDPDARTVRVDAGCCWGDVDHATHAFGLATVSGIIASTGVAGLTLGGGHGYLTRKHGLTVDNLLSADVVLADGRLVHASERQNPDLFWALRGGGGNFGVVTSFEYRLHPVDTVIAGPFFWPIEQLEPTLKWYREWLPSAPQDVYAFYLTGTVPPAPPFPEEIQGRGVCGLIWCYTGPQDQFGKYVQQARDVAKPLFEFTGAMPYPMLQSLFDGLYPPGDHWYWKGSFIGELTDEAIAEHERFAELPTPKSAMHLYPINGAVHRFSGRDTAWNRRDANWSMVIVGVDPEARNKEKITKWARDYWEALNPHTLGAGYLNFMMDEGRKPVRASYGNNYSRLQQVKAKYDPDNFFHVNQNIEPSSA